MKKIAFILLFGMATTFAANAIEAEVTLSCGIKGTYSCGSCSVQDMIRDVLIIDEYLCG